MQTLPWSRGRVIGTVMVATLCLMPGSGIGAQTPGDQAGVFAFGNIRYSFFPCFSLSCDAASDNSATQSKGSLGSRGPEIVDGFDARGTGNGSFSGRALISGAAAVLQLSASAGALPGTGMHVGYSAEGAYFFASSASATGRQYYTYTGAAPELYTMRYTLSGFAGYRAGTNPGLVQVSGGLSLFDDGDKLGGELPFGGQVDISQLHFNGTAQNFRQSASVSITLNPGDSYYMVGFLAANVGLMGDGTADASHTLNVEFTAGNTALLVPLLQAVPEPSGPALMALGLLLTGLAVRRRRLPRR